MEERLRPLRAPRVRLLESVFRARSDLNRRYLLSLGSAHILQNHYLEANLWTPSHRPEECHWGWESPTCQLRGHFLGHWLSAAARLYAATQDAEVKGKADWIVSELGRCQRENGGEWVASIPRKYLHWIAAGKGVWAPHYTIHKTLMGLHDMYAYAGSEEALDILVKAARWFRRWTSSFTREEMDDILDVETGGMLEVWADLYGITGDEADLELIERYDRPRLFDRLLEGEDPLTNRHANTTIPEVHGAARAWEVTGEERWRRVVEAYWKLAVTDRGYFCTGGQTSGEAWTPPGVFAPRLSETNQEHCTVYNMMRLADYLLRWTGDPSYADYWERNLYNGILVQQNPENGMVAYYMPLRAGSSKRWGSPTEDFWCCHGTLVQAHTMYQDSVYFEDDDGLAVCQYIPTELQWEWEGVPVRVTSRQVRDFHSTDRSNSVAVAVTVESERPVEFALKLRLPWWRTGEPSVRLNDSPDEVRCEPSGLCHIEKAWEKDTVILEVPKGLTTSPLPDRPDMVAFLDGPVVLSGLCDGERRLIGDPEDATTMLTPDNDQFAGWGSDYRTEGQEEGIRFVPLHAVRDETYTVYFPVRRPRRRRRAAP